MLTHYPLGLFLFFAETIDVDVTNRVSLRVPVSY